MVTKTGLKTDLFELVIVDGIGVANTPYTKLEVLPGGLARKHVVDVRLNYPWQDFNGTPITYKYSDAYVTHGMRGDFDTLDDTLEYIEVLKQAVKFAKQVNRYIKKNGWSIKN